MQEAPIIIIIARENADVRALVAALCCMTAGCQEPLHPNFHMVL